MTIEKFIERHGITMEHVPTPENPYHPNMIEGSAHYFCTLSVGKERKITTYYSKGPGLRVWRRTAKDTRFYGDRPFGVHPGRRAEAPWGATPYTSRAYEMARFKAWTDPEPPTLAEVLNCLAMDAFSLEDIDTFEEWAAELGYDPDSRSAEATYRQVQKQAQGLRGLLGEKDFRVLLDEVERL